MADNVLSTFSDFLYELRAPLQSNFRKLYPLSANIERRVSRDLMTGNQVRVPILLNSLQGGGGVAETGTINVPQTVNTLKTTATTQNYVQPFSLSPDLEEQTMDNAAAEAMALLVTEARNALAEIINDGLNAAGSKLSAITGGSSPGLTITVGTTAANFDRLYPGRVVDILTASSGADPGQGKRRKIASVSESAGTVTFSTTQTASDGGSGNITFSTNEAIYVAGTYGQSITSLHDLDATSGTVQGVDKGANAGWQGIDGRGGVTTTVALVDEIMDGAVRRGRRNGGFVWDFAIGDPAVIDLYKQSKYSQVRYDPQTATIQGGFTGIVYDGADKPIPLIKEDRFDYGTLNLIPCEDLKFYGKSGGPEFVNDDGSMVRRFNRNLSKEAWLRDKLQFVALRCNRLVKIANLSRAS